jgi:hypothetical protein
MMQNLNLDEKCKHRMKFDVIRLVINDAKRRSAHHIEIKKEDYGD